jgi:hypothetical protein
MLLKRLLVAFALETAEHYPRSLTALTNTLKYRHVRKPGFR